MRVCALILLAASSLSASEPELLALALRAQSDFDRVELTPIPQLADVGKCMQSQASLLAASAPEEMALVYFRRAYCTLAGATITSANREFLAAAADFDRAIEAWPARMRRKKQPPETVSTGLRVLPWIARLHAWTDNTVLSAAQREISAALAEPSCSSNLMPTGECEQLMNVGRSLLANIALRENRLDDAANGFQTARDSGWPEWVEGRRQFAQGHYPAAVDQYRRAITIWKSIWRQPGPTLIRRLGPEPDVPQALADLGGAQLLAGDTKSAIATLDASIKADPANFQAIYRRARAHDVAGHAELALADYNMASRTAFANAKDLASGEAHLYRGILLYRRKDFSRAEDEFASALNFDVPDSLRADVRGWRQMAAAAAGSCASAKELVDRALPAVSPYFPKDEARQVAAACASTSSAQLNPAR
jgi:tetratricopeptide (TPR) repeat protein